MRQGLQERQSERRRLTPATRSWSGCASIGAVPLARGVVLTLGNPSKCSPCVQSTVPASCAVA